MECWPSRPLRLEMRSGSAHARHGGGQASDRAPWPGSPEVTPVGEAAPRRDAPSHRQIRTETPAVTWWVGQEATGASRHQASWHRLRTRPGPDQPQTPRHPAPPYSLVVGWGVAVSPRSGTGGLSGTRRGRERRRLPSHADFRFAARAPAGTLIRALPARARRDHHPQATTLRNRGPEPARCGIRHRQSHAESDIEGLMLGLTSRV